MKHTLATLLLVATSTCLTSVALAANTEAKAAYTLAKETASADYKVAREKCNSLNDNPKDVCIQEANLAQTRTKAEAESKYKGTVKALASARTSIANAEYDLAKAKCNSQKDNARDVCIKEAKAANVAAKANTKADKKITEAKMEARDDKSDANYKVAVEKCDAKVGSDKDSCVSMAKNQFGK